MKKLYVTALLFVFCLPVFAQESDTLSVDEACTDTTTMSIGKADIIIINHNDCLEGDTIHKKRRRGEAHWAGIDFGFTMLMDQNFENKWSDHPYWKNDPARSHVWNINFLEYKFNIAKEYFGFTTGLGLSFTSVQFNDNYVLRDTPDTLFAEIDTVYNYKKNKLKASYLTLPLLFEVNTHVNPRKSFYLAFGVIGGVRMTSKVKRKGEFDGKAFTQKEKGKHSLNAFKLDAAVRLGYNDWGVFANYSLLPLFNDGKTKAVYPLTFGLSYNF